MPEIEIGEYVRTDEGNIFEFGGYFKSGNIDSMTDKDGILYGNQEKCCKKHSKNIIDLIEIDDYVNNLIVIGKYPDENNKICLILDTTDEIRRRCYSEDIKSIVTKEQFAQVQYEVGE